MTEIAVFTPDPADPSYAGQWPTVLERLSLALAREGITAAPTPWTDHVEGASGLLAYPLVLPLVVSSTLLFFAGVAFCYFFVFGRVFHFIAEFSPSSIAVTPDVENYLDFVMSMCLAFGCAFEVPVVVVEPSCAATLRGDLPHLLAVEHETEHLTDLGC